MNPTEQQVGLSFSDHKKACGGVGEGYSGFPTRQIEQAKLLKETSGQK